MQEQFVTYEIAKRLKELGFNDECLYLYSNGTEVTEVGELVLMAGCLNSDGEEATAPLWQQAIDWLEDKHGFFFERLFEDINKQEVFFLWRNGDIVKNQTHKSLEKAIEEALKLI